MAEGGLPPYEGGTWLRCQLHAHTTGSDGDASPAELCEHYAAAGFDAVAITDHWHVAPHRHEGLLVLPASELSAHANVPSGEAEALALGVGLLPEPREPFESIEQMAAWIRAEGGAGYLCHPYWSGLGAADVVAAPSLHGIEVWNGAGELLQGNGLSTVHWDEVLQQGSLVAGIATDDCHSPGVDSGLGWTWVYAAERSLEAVVDALRRGHAYGSSGPRLDSIEVTPDAVLVCCSAARSVRLRSGPWDGCAVNADGAAWRGSVTGRAADGLVEAARFDYPELWRWARVEVEDDHGRLAWSNAFVLAEAPR